MWGGAGRTCSCQNVNCIERTAHASCALNRFTPQERALVDAIERHFDHLITAREPTERSLQILVRMMAGVLAAEMGARGLTETALTRTVDPYQRLLKTWIREALAYARAQEADQQRRPLDDA
jgi:hypothetical protein